MVEITLFQIVTLHGDHYEHEDRGDIYSTWSEALSEVVRIKAHQHSRQRYEDVSYERISVEFSVETLRNMILMAIEEEDRVAGNEAN